MNQKTVLLIFLGVLFVLQSACTRNAVDIQKSIPVNRFESPEINDGKSNINFGQMQSQVMVLTGDIEETAPESQSPGFRKSETETIGYSYGILDYLEIGLENTIEQISGRTDVLFRPKVKFQVLGDPLSKSEGGNVSLALTYAISTVKRQDSNRDDICVGGCTGDVVSYEDSWRQDDVAAILGIRVVKHLLIYTNIFYTNVNYSGSWEILDPSSQLIVDSGNFHGKSISQGKSIGLIFGSFPVQLMLEIAQFETVSDESIFEDISTGLRMNIVF